MGGVFSLELAMADAPDSQQIIKRAYDSARNALRVITVAEAVEAAKRSDSQQVLKKAFSTTTNSIRGVSTV